MYCGQCGTDNATLNRFCMKCGAALSPPQATVLQVQCITGADAGKAYAIGSTQSILGRCAGLVDPVAGDRHVLVSLNQNGIRFRTLPGCYLEIDGIRMEEGHLVPGQQFRIGASTWQVAGGAATPVAGGNPLDAVKRKLNEVAGTDKLEGFSLKEMFSEVFKRRTSQEIEDYFIAGTSRTTPDILDVQTGWPKPWFFFRVLVFVAALYLGLDFAAGQFQNTKMLPGMMIMGSLAVPFATVILFFELNAPRNVPFHRVLMLVCFGGVVSLLISLFGFSVSNLGWLGASSAGIIEETGKLLTVALILRTSRSKYILNGLLYGAAVGAGFAFFESAGYAFDQMMAAGTLSAATANIEIRAILAPFGHVAWTAISAGALWRAKGEGTVTLQTLLAPTFLKAFLIPVALHMLWDAPFELPFMAKYWIIGAAAWFVVFGLVQQGLKQVKQAQNAAKRASAEYSMQTAS